MSASYHCDKCLKGKVRRVLDFDGIGYHEYCYDCDTCFVSFGSWVQYHHGYKEDPPELDLQYWDEEVSALQEQGFVVSEGNSLAA